MKTWKDKPKHSFDTVVSSRPQRSKFNRSWSLKTTMNAGELIPLDVEEILPGDSISMNTKAIMRSSTMIVPVMDNGYMDIMVFGVPLRIIWEELEKFFGANDDPWAELSDVAIPKIKAPVGGWEIGTIADYLGVPPKKDCIINALPFRAVAKITNDWFRDQNLQTAAFYNKDSVQVDGSNGDNYIQDLAKGGKPFIAGKYHDYFTSALPDAQKGDAITINLGGNAPVVNKAVKNNVQSSVRLGDGWSEGFEGQYDGVQIRSNSKPIGDHPNDIAIQTSGNLHDYDASRKHARLFVEGQEAVYADLSNATGLTINQLRESITLQQMLELDARAGTRYTEYLKSHFGVENGDARLQRSEYLGGFHQPLGVQQVPQTSASSEGTPQATLAAFGETRLVEEGVIRKTFTEHSYVITMGVIRYYHTYQQGLDALWSVSSKYDIYDPIFAHIGEQPIKNKEIYLSGDVAKDNEAFGFQEAWARYRYKPSRTSGKMRSAEKDSLDVYHYGDYYTETPKLSADWIKEDKNNIDRTLAIKSSGENAQPQYQMDFFITYEAERPMPTFSDPGLKRI